MDMHNGQYIYLVSNEKSNSYIDCTCNLYFVLYLQHDCFPFTKAIIGGSVTSCPSEKFDITLLIFV